MLNVSITADFEFVFEENTTEKSRDYCCAIVFGKLRFCDGLVWTEDLTVEIKLCFCDGLVWTEDLTVEIKLCFCDGLVWTVDLTVEIKLRFCDGLVWTVDLTGEIKLRFLWRVSVDCRPNRRKRAGFLNSSGVVGTGVALMISITVSEFSPSYLPY